MANDSLEKTLSGGSRDIPEEGPVKPDAKNRFVFIEKGEGEDEKELVEKTGGNFGNFQRMFGGELGVGEQAFTLPDVSEEQLEEPITEEDVKRGSRLKEEDGRVEPVGVKDIALNIWEGLGDFGGTEESAIANYLVNTPAADAINKAQSIISDSDVRLTDVFKQGVKRKARNADNSIPEPPEDFQSGSTSSSQQDSFSSPEEQNFGLPEQESDSKDKSKQQTKEQSGPLSENEAFVDRDNDGEMEFALRNDQDEELLRGGGGAPRTKPVDKTESDNVIKGEDDTTHKVKEGETLSKIGKKFGVPWENIARRNNIENPKNIQPGDNIVIPSLQESPSTEDPTEDITQQTKETGGTDVDEDSMIGKQMFANVDRVLNGKTDFTESTPLAKRASDIAGDAIAEQNIDMPKPEIRKTPSDTSKDAQDSINENDPETQQDNAIGSHLANVFGFIASMSNPEIYQSYVRSAQQDRRLDLRETQQKLKQRQQRIDRSKEIIESKNDFAEDYQEQIEKLPNSELTDTKRREIFVNLARENRNLIGDLRETGQLESFRRGVTQRNVEDTQNKFGVQFAEQQAKSAVNRIAQADSQEEVDRIVNEHKKGLVENARNMNINMEQKKALISLFESRVSSAKPELDEGASGSSGDGEDNIDQVIEVIDGLSPDSDDPKINLAESAFDSLDRQQKKELVKRDARFRAIDDVERYINARRSSSTAVTNENIQENKNEIRSELTGVVNNRLSKKADGREAFLNDLGLPNTARGMEQASKTFMDSHFGSPTVSEPMDSFLGEHRSSVTDQRKAKEAVKTVESKIVEQKLNRELGQYDRVDDAVDKTGVPDGGFFGTIQSYLGTQEDEEEVRKRAVSPQRKKNYQDAKIMITHGDQYTSNPGSSQNVITKYIDNTLRRSDVDIQSSLRRDIFKQNLKTVIGNSQRNISTGDRDQIADDIISRIDKNGDMSLEEIGNAVNSAIRGEV